MQGWGDLNLFSLQVIIYWCFVNTHLVPSTNAQVPVCLILGVICGLFFSTRSVLLWFSLVPRWVLCEWPSTQPWPQPFLEVPHSRLYISLCYTFCCMKLTKPALYCRYIKPLCVSGVTVCQYLWDLPPWKSTWLRRGGYWLGWVHHVTQFICTLYIVHFTQHLIFCRELGSYANTTILISSDQQRVKIAFHDQFIESSTVYHGVILVLQNCFQSTPVQMSTDSYNILLLEQFVYVQTKYNFSFL